jgi:hypothetical protein
MFSDYGTHDTDTTSMKKSKKLSRLNKRRNELFRFREHTLHNE